MDRDEVSHELRTPLTTIKAVFRLLMDHRLDAIGPDEVTRLLERAWVQINRLERVVERVESEYSAHPDPYRAIVLYEEIVV